MRIEQLQYFISVAKTQSINKTSLEFYTTHQGISKAIRQLEEEMGAPLFERSPRGMILTPEGELLLPEAEACVNKLHSVQLEIAHRNRKKDVEGTLHIWSTALPNTLILPGLLEDFRQLYPKVRYHINAVNPFDALRHLALHREAVGLVNIIHAPGFREIYEPYLAGLNVCSLQKDEFVCLVSAASPLAGRSQISFAEFCRYPVASIVPQSDEDYPVQLLLRKFGNTELDFASLSPRLLAQMLASGEYVCLSSRRGRTEADYFKSARDRIVVIPFEEDLSIDLMLATNAQPQLGEIEQAFYDMVYERVTLCE